MSTRTLALSVGALALLLTAAACKQTAPAPPPPPPPQRADVNPPTPAPPPAPKPQAARIDTFVAEPSTIDRGQSATLRWTVANATDISLDRNLGTAAANGIRQVSPANTTTYTLTARGAGANATRSVTITVTAPAPPPPPATSAKPALSSGDLFSGADGSQDIYFDDDKSDVRNDARPALQHDADLLKRIFAADPNFTVVIQGHCDERGSAEYNLGLGDRRGTSVKEFLVGLGVPENRMRTISYGKERPTCVEQTPECFQRNRRVHLAPAQ